jgi:hypothetical protein
VTRSSILLGAAALLVAVTPAPAAQFGLGHDYARLAGSSWLVTRAASKCHRVCVQTVSHGPAAAPQCVRWEYIC